MFFHVGLCSPLRTMKGGWLRLYSRCIGVLEVVLLLMGPSVMISRSSEDFIKDQC